MDVNSCIKRVRKYLERKGSSLPRLVNVQNIEDLRAIEDHFRVGSDKIIHVADYAKKDENPKLEELKRAISTADKNVFVFGLTSYLRLKGQDALRNGLQDIASKSYSVCVVVLCYQCEQYLNFRDPRLKDFVYRVDGQKSNLPDIIFVAPELSLPDNVVPGHVTVDGIELIAKAVENNGVGTLFVKTKKHKDFYPNAMFDIKEISSSFEALEMIDRKTSALNRSLGTDQQWNYALTEVNKAGSWEALIGREFTGADNLAMSISDWETYDRNTRWLYFIALKLYGARNNKCLDTAVKNSDSTDKLPRNIYRSLIKVLPTSPTFWAKYEERKILIKKMVGTDKDMMDRETRDYVQVLNEKKSDALYYLTDSSQLEKEKIFELLDKYADISKMDKIAGVLQHVYPDLYNYLLPYDFKNDELNYYFQHYKLQKVINKIDPGFLKIVEEQAIKRDFWNLSPRSQEIEPLIKKDGAILYFIDAMGVEYLGFIMARCKSLNMRATVNVCRCELPSITRCNKAFVEASKQAHVNVVEIGELDDIKHNGKESINDYQQTKLPIYMIRELEIIDDKLRKISNQLSDGSFKRAYIISDHGASRLAVIYETENKWEMAEKGEHSGRCCPKSDIDIQPDYATEATTPDGKSYWVLANYDRFKGSRKASVEVHGGASLEEVAVPIIELTYINGEIEISISSKLPIEVSFRKKAEIVIFSKTKLENVTVRVNGEKLKNKCYNAEPQDNNLYLIRMPDIRRAGDYSMTVLSNENEVAELKFTVKKEGVSERNIL